MTAAYCPRAVWHSKSHTVFSLVCQPFLVRTVLGIDSNGQAEKALLFQCLAIMYIMFPFTLI